MQEHAKLQSRQPCPVARSKAALDWFNFFVADVQMVFGSFASLYLAASGWKQRTIGTLLAVNSIVAIVVQRPAGGPVDRARRKRLIVGIGSAA